MVRNESGAIKLREKQPGDLNIAGASYAPIMLMHVRNKQQIDWFRLTNIHKHRSRVITHSVSQSRGDFEKSSAESVFAFEAHDNFK